MPATLKPKPLPENHGDQILELFCVCRKHGEAVEIAEHSDGALKAYGSKRQAERARSELQVTGVDLRDNPWTVETIWLLDKGHEELWNVRAHRKSAELD